jgi:hypothetical protein
MIVAREMVADTKRECINDASTYDQNNKQDWGTTEIVAQIINLQSN